MKFRAFPINTYLFLVLALLLAGGCKTTEEKKKSKMKATLRLYLEVNPDGTPFNEPVLIFRNKPFSVNVTREPFADEGHVDSASVVDVDREGGFAIRVQMNESGRLILNNTTTAYRGQRIAVLCAFQKKKDGEARWLAAPIIQKTISDGVFVFTPDATREEAEQIVLGLNNVAKELKKPFVF